MNEDGRLDPKLSSVSNELMDAARINATYVPSSTIGSCISNGTYDELIGNLERNITDFVIIPTSLELLLNDECQIPVTFDTILTQRNNHILSSPVRNVIKTVQSVHEAFCVFDWSAILVFMAVYFFSLWLLWGSKVINALSRTYAWTITRVWLCQDEGSSPSSQSGKTVLTTSKLVVFQIIILVGALINTDLVTYSKPRLINTVSDVIESGIRVAFYKGTGVYSNLKAAPDGSDAKMLLKHALEQSGNRTSDITVPFGPHRSLVTVVLDVSYEVALRLDCAQSEKYYKSRDVIYSERRAILFSRTCDPEIRRRVNRIHVRAMESGIIVKNGQIIQI